jgi:hypothetical protein
MYHDFGVRRQSEAATALWLFLPWPPTRAVSRFACHRTPHLRPGIVLVVVMRYAPRPTVAMIFIDPFQAAC